MKTIISKKSKLTHLLYNLLLINICVTALLLLFDNNCRAAELIQIRLKHLFAFDAIMSGTPLKWVDKITIDNQRDEIYLLDKSNKRIIITDTSGVYLSQIRYESAGIKSPLSLDIDPPTGNIYVAERGRIAVLNYRGNYLYDIDLSSIPDYDKLSIQSIDLDHDKRLIFIGENQKGRIIVISLDGSFVKQFGKENGIDSNVASIHVTDKDISFIDASTFSVYMLSRAGGPRKLKFGKVSSLLGGFSMLSDLAIDKKKKRLIVMDTNRMMVIVFDWNGNTLFEFGSPTMFSWPRAVAIDGDGHFYIADNTGKVNAIQVVEEAPKVVAEKKPEPPPARMIEQAPVVPQKPFLPQAPAKIKKPVFNVIEKLTARIYFDTNRVLVRDDDEKSMAEINKVIEFLNKYPKASVVIIGHTDSVGSESYNQKLSERRAQTTKDYLVEKGIIEESRVKAIGYGETEPIASNSTIEGRQENRREEILIVSE